MSTTKNLSVIIPVYNGEEHLARCLDSILNQSLKDIEIIVVNDASEDQTLSLAKKYESKYSNICVINLNKNSGTGKARNIGLSKANSEFITFLDADDWIDSNTYLVMYREMKKGNTDIAVCGIRTEFNNYLLSESRYEYRYQNTISGWFALKLLCRTEMQDSFISPMVGNKIFSKKFLKNNNIFFPQLKYFEDDAFMFIAFYYAENISLIPDVNHHYYQRNSSAMHTFSKEYINCFIQCFQFIKEYLPEQHGSIEYCSLMRRCFSTLLNLLFTYEQSDNTKTTFLQYLLEELIKNFSIKELTYCIDFDRIYRL